MMTSDQYQQLMTRIRELLQVRRHCPCGRLHETPTQQVIIATGALDRLPEVLTELGLTGKALLVADANTYQAAGRPAEGILTQAGRDVTELLIEPESGQSDVEATDEPVQLVQQDAADFDYLIAVGSGTVNDIVKLAATRLGIPYVLVATAASMTGYSSGIAAIRSGGIKRTIPATPPLAIIADIEVIASAPAQMRAAGVGDLISRSPSSTDWKLASLLRGDYFCPWIAQLAEQADQQCRRAVCQIRQGRQDTLELLMSGLVLAGIAITMAQTSAPASGGGHLISHYWDMTAAARGRHHSLHGLQVALGDLICTALYEKLWARIGEIDVDKLVAMRLPAAEFARQTHEHYAPLIGTEAAQQIAQAATSKYATGDQLRRQLARVMSKPDRAWAQLEPLFTPGQQLRELFDNAGLPRTVSECGISPEEVACAYGFASRLRERYTVLDLAYDLGLLDELREEVFAEAGVVSPAATQ